MNKCSDRLMRCHQVDRYLFVGIMSALCMPAMASTLPEPIDVRPEYTLDNHLTRWKKPAYPDDALKLGLAGEVTIEFDPDRHGGLTNVQVVNSKPPGIFDAAVLATLNWWTIVPYRAASCSAKFPRTRITIRFDLEKGSPKVVALRPAPLVDPMNARSQNSADDTILDLATVCCDDGKKTTKLRWKHAPNPEYPLRTNRLYPMPGFVSAIATVQPDGTVGDVNILLSAPHPAFGEEVQHALKSSRAVAAGGEPPGTSVKVCLPFNFTPN